MSTTLPGISYEPNDVAPAKGYRLNVRPRLDTRDYLDPDETKLRAAKQPAMSMMAVTSPVIDQLPLGSCTANGEAGMYATMLLNAGQPLAWISRLMLYYAEREIEHDIPEDAGADPRDGLAYLKKSGVGREDLWPYDIRRFTERPPQAAYDDAKNHKIGAYYRVVSLHNLKDKILRNIPVGNAWLVYDQAERTTNGVIAMPPNGAQPLGGHWTFFTGYCDRPDWPGGGYLRLQNSWGMSAGDHGLYYMPYAYAMNSQLNPVMWRFTLPKAG